MTLHQTGRYETENASKYLKQLCKHFAHKVEVDYDDTRGKAQLPSGPCVLQATDTCLRIEISGPDEAGLERARGVVDSHLERFAFREGFKTMTWETA
jgi:hypothetical protein